MKEGHTCIRLVTKCCEGSINKWSGTLENVKNAFRQTKNLQGHFQNLYFRPAKDVDLATYEEKSDL